MASQMLNTKIAKPYALALLDVAIANEAFDTIVYDMNCLISFYSKSESNRLKKFFLNPVYDSKSKKLVSDKVADALEISDFSKNLFRVLIDRNRIGLIELVAKEVLRIAYTFFDIQLISIISAFPLTEKQEVKLLDSLKKILKFNTDNKSIIKFKLVTQCDKSLLGGLQIKIGSCIIDASLKTQLRQIASRLEIN